MAGLLVTDTPGGTHDVLLTLTHATNCNTMYAVVAEKQLITMCVHHPPAVPVLKTPKYPIHFVFVSSTFQVKCDGSGFRSFLYQLYYTHVLLLWHLGMYMYMYMYVCH